MVMTMCHRMTLSSKRSKSLHKTPFTVFASDVHLSPAHPMQLELFLLFLHEKAAHAQALYILGDLFDVWVGKDIHSEFHQIVLQALKKVSDKIPVYFIHGNRDFLCTRNFLAQAGIQKLPDPYLISLYGVPTLLSHGDKLCTLDKAYQRYRRVAQNPVVRSLFLKLPLKAREKISVNLRQKSQQYQQQQQTNILDVTESAVINVMQKYHARQLIHGHVHRPKFHEHQLQHATGHRYVLGDWHHKGNYIVSTPNSHTLIHFDESDFKATASLIIS